MKYRDYHKLAIIRRQARGFTGTVPSKKGYKRHPKHKGRRLDI